MRSYSIWAFGLMLLICAVAGAQSLPADQRGIFVYTEHLSQYQQQVLQSLTVAGVDGLTYLQNWGALETAKGTYNWTEMDQFVGAAVSSGKKVTLAIRAGGTAPCWLFQAPACGAGYNKPYAGAVALAFQVSARQGVGQGNCTTATMAAPWDPIFLSEWDATLAAVAAHLKSVGTYSAITSVRLTGINRSTAELRLPEEILTTPCVTNSIQTWLQAPVPYRPSRLLAAWDAVTNSFLKNFPEKYFGLEVVPDNTGNNSFPFPEIDENGCIYSAIVSPASAPGACINNGHLADDIAPLVQLAAAKFAGRLTVSFQNLDITTGADTYPIQDAQMLGTGIGYQTNDYNNLQSAACSGTFLTPGVCTSASYLALLEVGIYPLGKTDALRAQYIEVLPPDVLAFPDAILQAHNELLSSFSFRLANRGSTSLTSSGASSSISVGYARIQPDNGSHTPSGVAIFDYGQNNILVSEVGVPATPALISGRIYAEIAGPVDAGLAIVNPNSSAATISFYFTDAGGNSAGSGSTTIAANQQTAQFLDQAPFKVYTTPTFQGTFTFTSSVPVAVVALRGFTNERGDFLMSTLPVIDTTIAPNAGTSVVPHFADGGGWTTQVLLVNPTDNPMTGTLQFANPTSTAANVTIGGQTNSSFVYSIPKRTSTKLATSGLTPITSSGSIRITPTGGGAGPTPLVVFSYKPAGITVSESGVPVSNGTAFRVYVEASGVPGRSGNIESGIAVANTSTASANLTFDVTDLTGTPVSGIPPVTTTLPGTGQTAKFLSDIFPSLPSPFKGVLRITATSSGISVVGLRTRINERGDFLITTTPPTNETSAPTTASMYFPQVADGGGYTTQFILFSGTAGQATSGNLQLIKQDGSAFGLPLN